MGITRDILHKRRLTGGKKAIWRKKRKYNLGRQPANTKLGPKAVRPVRVRGGNYKFRALRLDTGNYSWGSESVTRKTRIVAVVYNASNNELVRTNTLVKGCIVQIDATPFRQWYSQQYGIEIGKKKKDEIQQEEQTESKEKTADQKKLSAVTRPVEKALLDQFSTGKLLARVSSRPGQCGRCDGYILEGKELEFYQRQMQRRKKSGKQ